LYEKIRVLAFIGVFYVRSCSRFFNQALKNSQALVNYSSEKAEAEAEAEGREVEVQAKAKTQAEVA
jgi:hypothetical protein